MTTLQTTMKRDDPIPGEMPAYGSNSQTLTERELEVVRALSEEFPGQHLETSVLAVRTLEGAEVETLRFTLGGLASSDLHRDRIGGGETTKAACVRAGAGAS